jgi:hypothetical protein
MRGEQPFSGNGRPRLASLYDKICAEPVPQRLIDIIIQAPEPQPLRRWWQIWRW